MDAQGHRQLSARGGMNPKKCGGSKMWQDYQAGPAIVTDRKGRKKIIARPLMTWAEFKGSYKENQY